MFSNQVLGLNLKGLKALNKADFRLAVECFTEAITLDGKCSTSHANRSEAFAGINGKLDDALTDAENVCVFGASIVGAMAEHIFPEHKTGSGLRIGISSERRYLRPPMEFG